jgi:hypothetical protein
MAWKLEDGGWLEAAHSWGHTLKSMPCPLFLSLFLLLPDCHELRSFAPPFAPCHSVLPHLGLKAMDPVDHGLKPLKLNVLPPLSCLPWPFCHRGEKLTQKIGTISGIITVISDCVVQKPLELVCGRKLEKFREEY